MGLGISFVASGGRTGRAVVNLTIVIPAFERCVRGIRKQKCAYICKVNQSPVGNHLAMISLFTMSWRLL